MLDNTERADSVLGEAGRMGVQHVPPAKPSNGAGGDGESGDKLPRHILRGPAPLAPDEPGIRTVCVRVSRHIVPAVLVLLPHHGVLDRPFAELCAALHVGAAGAQVVHTGVVWDLDVHCGSHPILAGGAGQHAHLHSAGRVGAATLSHTCADGRDCHLHRCVGGACGGGVLEDDAGVAGAAARDRPACAPDRGGQRAVAGHGYDKQQDALPRAPVDGGQGPWGRWGDGPSAAKPRLAGQALLRAESVAIDLLSGNVPDDQSCGAPGDWRWPDSGVRVSRGGVVEVAEGLFERQRWDPAADCVCVQPGLCAVQVPAPAEQCASHIKRTHGKKCKLIITITITITIIDIIVDIGIDIGIIIDITITIDII